MDHLSSRQNVAKTARLVLLAHLVWLTSYADSALGIQAESNAYVSIENVDDVIENWSLEQHLFIKGDVGATSVQLNKLEEWLDQNGKHWTVVLMHNARDEKYTAPDGERFLKMDAVEYALAHRLANQTEFGNLVHETTRESSGAVFVLYLVERKFAYYSSDVYDQRGLGESRWVGDLDREAIRAMRSGDRIIDAVKNTVKQIEGRLQRKIRKEELDEKLAKQRVELERKKYLSNLQSLISETESTMIPRVEESARAVRTKFPDAKESELAKPPVETWRTQLRGFQKESENPLFETMDLRNSKDFQVTKKGVVKLRSEINRFLDSYAAHESFDELLYSIEGRLDEVADHPSGMWSQTSIEAYTLIDEARSGHARGELGFAANIAQAKELIEQGELAIANEQKRLKAEADRKRLVRKTLWIVAACLAVAFLGLLWLLNIRRRPALRRAHALFAKQSKAVEIELAKIEEVITESETIVGTPDSFAEKQFEGETLHLGNATHAQIGDLKAMTSEANRVVDFCHELIQPSNPIAEAANMFTGARYEHCVNDLNGKTLHVPGRRNESGVVDESVWMSFDEFFTEIHLRKNDAIENLVTFDSSVTEVEKQVDELQQKIEETTKLEKKLSRASRLDRIFKVPALFETLIPSAQKLCDRAESMSSTDPVKAVLEVVPDGVQKIDSGLSIAKTIDRARENGLTKMDNAGKELKKLRFDKRWIGERIEKLSTRADQIVLDANDADMMNQAISFDDDMKGMVQRVERTLELGQRVDQELMPQHGKLLKRILSARDKISKTLNVGASQALNEEGYKPDAEADQAHKQLLAARASLDYGGVESAMESFEEFDIEMNHAGQLIENSLVALRDFDSTFSKRNSDFVALDKRIPEAKKSIDLIRSRYADSALVVRDDEFVAGSWDDLEPEENDPTVDDIVKGCRELAKHSKASIAQLNTDHHSGRVLQAANSLDLVGGDLEVLDEMLIEIDEHCQRVEALATENVGTLKSTTERLSSLESEVDDGRTQNPTVQQHKDLAGRLAKFGEAFANAKVERDPFGDAISIGEFDGHLDDLATALKADRRAHDEATRAVVGAEAELSAANKLVSVSLNDGVPDSRMIGKCQEDVAELDLELSEIKKSLKQLHGNWKSVNGEATQTTSRLGVVGGRLRRELELAQQAVNMLAQASNSVYEAANWRGRYSIVVVGRPGSDELEQARRLLARGSYERSIEFSKAAVHNARQGIEKAQRQVARHRRKLARRAAEKRRRRQSSLSLSFGNSSRSSSRSSSFGSSSRSSSRSSSSSSSSSSRSSGFSRSGW